MNDAWKNRLARELGVPELLELLTTRLSRSDLGSLMLELSARIAGNVTAGRLLQQYEQDRFVRPAVTNPKLIVELDRLAYSLLPSGYQALELSPLAPLGSCSAVASVHQNKVVATTRGTEVVSDATNVMALECAARRRKGDRREAVRLAASHRMTRAQTFAGAKTWAHFRLFSLCAGGRDEGDFRFELRHAAEQLAFHLRFLAALPGLGRPRVAVTDVTDGRRTQAMEEQLLSSLRRDFPSARIEMDPTRTSGRGYYENLCFKIFVDDKEGKEMEIGDGGDVPWTRSLLSDAKERLLISAIATERLVATR